MSNRTINMSKLKRAFQMLSTSTPQREICEKLRMGRGVLNNYKKLADSLGLDYSSLGRMSDPELHLLLYPPLPESSCTPQKKSLEELVPDYAHELSRNRYLTILRLHDEYKRDYPDGYGYTQFKKAIRDYQYAHNLSYHNVYQPGVELQIDFAGDVLYLTDRRTDLRIPVVLLCCVLAYSGLGYAKAMPDATMEHFFSGLSDTFTYMGGVTAIAKSDNMKQWVKKYDRYEPSFTDAAMEWSAYYDTSLETCRVKTPRDKGVIEGLVNKFYQFIYAALRKEVFYSLTDLNFRIMELTIQFNDRVSRLTGKSRMQVFQSEEKESLKPLPDTPYRFRHKKEVKLTGNYHVMVGKEKHLYSVPYQYVGQTIRVLWDMDTVEVYAGMDRIALHQRHFTAGYTTLDSHMPDNHLAYKRSKGYNAAYYQERACEIGPNTGVAVSKILQAPKYVEHAYRSCQGVLSLQKKYVKERLENACRRIADTGGVTYMMIKNILMNNLDKKESEPIVSSIPENDDVRGAEAFANF